MNDFYISPSSLEKFFTCPHQYMLSKTYSPIKPPPPWVEDGLLVHRWMAGERDVLMLNEKQRAHVKLLESKIVGYEIIETEIKQKVQIARNLQIVRIIDAIAESPDHGVFLIDYKTTGKTWATVSGRFTDVAPASMGWQAMAYLVPPPDGDWPKHIKFVVSVGGKSAHIYGYEYSASDTRELIQAIRIVRNAVSKNYFPRRRSTMCQYCDYQPICYNVGAWWTDFDEKKEEHNGTEE